MMRDVQPPPSYEMNHRVTVHVFDQTYEWVGMKKHGARSVIETHNAQGMPVTIENEVYINSIEVTSARRHFLVILFIHWFIGTCCCCVSGQGPLDSRQREPGAAKGHRFKSWVSVHRALQLAVQRACTSEGGGGHVASRAGARWARAT